MNYKGSYSAADNFPVKVIQNAELVREIVENRRIIPIHIQFIPTNKCNLFCSFCSCDDEDRKIEMPLEKAKEIIKKFKSLGTKSVTITGGGEPLRHPDIDEIINEFHINDIEIGLVTNGTFINTINSLKKITWCRISHSDERKFHKAYEDGLEKVIKENNRVDWAFSYVVSGKPNFNRIKKVINFANKNDFTHVRIVSDIFNADKIPSSKIESTLRDSINCEKVIFQSRDKPTRGSACYICFLKPIISADCKIFTCCGAQYAINGSDKRMNEKLCLGAVDDIDRIFSKTHMPFNGSVCDVCYYKNYNDVLGKLLIDINHKKFV